MAEGAADIGTCCPHPAWDTLQVGGGQEPAASAEAVDMHLNMLRGAVAAYGGSVDVLSGELVVCVR